MMRSAGERGFGRTRSMFNGFGGSFSRTRSTSLGAIDETPAAAKQVCLHLFPWQLRAHIMSPGISCEYLRGPPDHVLFLCRRGSVPWAVWTRRRCRWLQRRPCGLGGQQTRQGSRMEKAALASCDQPLLHAACPFQVLHHCLSHGSNLSSPSRPRASWAGVAGRETRAHCAPRPDSGSFLRTRTDGGSVTSMTVPDDSVDNFFSNLQSSSRLVLPRRDSRRHTCCGPLGPGMHSCS